MARLGLGAEEFFSAQMGMGGGHGCHRGRAGLPVAGVPSCVPSEEPALGRARPSAAGPGSRATGASRLPPPPSPPRPYLRLLRPAGSARTSVASSRLLLRHCFCLPRGTDSGAIERRAREHIHISQSSLHAGTMEPKAEDRPVATLTTSLQTEMGFLCPCPGSEASPMGHWRRQPCSAAAACVCEHHQV